MDGFGLNPLWEARVYVEHFPIDPTKKITAVDNTRTGMRIGVLEASNKKAAIERLYSFFSFEDKDNNVRYGLSNEEIPVVRKLYAFFLPAAKAA